MTGRIRDVCKSWLLTVAFAMAGTACYQEEEIPVVADFVYEIPSAGYTVPVEINLVNNTTGADFYQWSFQGGSPSTSDKKQPGTITYAQAGTYSIKLEAWNDTQRAVKEITIVLDSAVTLDFDYNVLINDFVPATVQMVNKTRGASTFEWTFEGGEPSSSAAAIPPPIYFATPGDHVIGLKVTNGRETFFLEKVITLKPALQTEFSIVPSFEDEDYEAPLKASLVNQSVSGLRYTWSSDGGTIDDVSSSDPSVHFDLPGTYTVTLQVENDKETKSVERTITVKPNSNLYVMEDVRLGISAAHSTSGCFYSTSLRKTLNKQEVTSENDELIDIVFYAINSGFSYCRFISPDSVGKFTFPSIPGATHTTFINTLESTSLNLSVTDFDLMKNDDVLRDLMIEGNDTKTAFFDNGTEPRIILFQTADGRKGAIKVKAFVANGAQSYITMDVKVQKKMTGG